MNVLVSAASKHGGTAEIVTAIAGELAAAELEVTVLPPDHVSDPDVYDAIVLGSAVYANHWLPAARSLADRLATQSTRPVWLFSSGPVGNPPKPTGDPADMTRLLANTRAREHRVFGGRIERARLGMAERAVCVMLRIRDCDNRDWDQIAAWARHIAEELRTTAPQQTHS